MTRVAFVGDPHVGNFSRYGGEMRAGLNNRCRITLESLRQAVSFSKTANVEAMVLLGDTFDTARPAPQVIAAVQRLIEDVPTVMLVGNHDRVSDAVGDHALGPFEPVATVIEEPTVVPVGGVDLLCLPSFPGLKDQFEEQVEALVCEARRKATHLLCFHMGIEDNNTPKHLKGSRSAVTIDRVREMMEAFPSIAYCFNGDWHEHQRWEIDEKRGACQVGTLNPTGWDNKGTESYGAHVVWGKGAITAAEIPGPRFVDVNGPAAESFINGLHEAGHAVFVRWKATLEEFKDAKAGIKEWLAAGLIAGGKAELDDPEVEEAAKHAAKTARKAETLAEAITAFVKEMPLEVENDRELLLALVRKYMRVE